MRLQPYLSQKLQDYFQDILHYAQQTIQEPDEVEHLHQFRVSTRRAQSILREFKGCFEPAYLQKSRQLLKRFIKVSNDARDLDVLLLTLSSWDLPDPLHLEELQIHLRRARKEAYGALHEELAKVPALLYALLGPKIVCKRSLKKALKDAFRRSIERLRRLGSSIHSDEEFHRFRVALKRARYIAELMVQRGLMPPKRLKRLKALQDLFGQIQDASVQSRRLLTLAQQEEFDKMTYMAMGKVMADLLERKERLKRRLREDLQKRLRALGV
ncbi:MAG: hypothetical protein C6H99_05735 [Epsilonproteobacteria bacterium]|nr:hypothetical protein [Campylobacterota bacterium]NPA64278.1 CHAD domain-containing protein [Campylobacterota bacterium]